MLNRRERIRLIKGGRMKSVRPVKAERPERPAPARPEKVMTNSEGLAPVRPSNVPARPAGFKGRLKGDRLAEIKRRVSSRPVQE